MTDIDSVLVPDRRGGKRGAHGAGNSHACLLERKHQVEDTIYRLGGPAEDASILRQPLVEHTF